MARLWLCAKVSQCKDSRPGKRAGCYATPNWLKQRCHSFRYLLQTWKSESHVRPRRQPLNGRVLPQAWAQALSLRQSDRCHKARGSYAAQPLVWARRRSPAVTRLAAEQVQENEPHVRCLASLKVPSTGIVNYREVSAKYVELIKSQGRTVQTGTRVDRLRYVNGTHVIGNIPRRGPIHH